MSIITHHYHQINPKNTQYFTNGTGRDTYISTMSTVPALKLPKITSEKTHAKGESSFRYRNFDSIKYSSLDNKIVHYVSDGSGRDKYIKSNEGGLAYNVSGCGTSEAFFESNLRTYHTIKSIHQGSSQAFLPPLQRLRNKEIYKSQEILNNRLAAPKYIKEKTEEDNFGAKKVLNTL